MTCFSTHSSSAQSTHMYIQSPREHAWLKGQQGSSRLLWCVKGNLSSQRCVSSLALVTEHVYTFSLCLPVVPALIGGVADPHPTSQLGTRCQATTSVLSPLHRMSCQAMGSKTVKVDEATWCKPTDKILGATPGQFLGAQVQTLSAATVWMHIPCISHCKSVFFRSMGRDKHFLEVERTMLVGYRSRNVLVKEILRLHPGWWRSSVCTAFRWFVAADPQKEACQVSDTRLRKMQAHAR